MKSNNLSDREINLVLNSLKINKSTLIHGDFSPKNILIGKKSPVILDAETACWGDGIFDLAFCCNHLILKSILNRDKNKTYIIALDKFINKYLTNLEIDKKNDFVIRFLNLIPILMLARVDGKSPVDNFKITTPSEFLKFY